MENHMIEEPDYTRDPLDARTKCPGGCGEMEPEDCQCCHKCGYFVCRCEQIYWPAGMTARSTGSRANDWMDRTED